LAVISGYVTLIGVSNLDILLSYLILRGGALGVYSGSSVFPKGILVFVTPLLQMLYPIMAGHERAPTQVKIIFQKSVAVVLLLAAGMALVVLALSQLVCGTSWGLQSCRPGPLQILLISAVLLSGLRALVFYNSARGRDWIAVSMLLPAAGYTWIALLSPQSVDTRCCSIHDILFALAPLLLHDGAVGQTALLPSCGGAAPQQIRWVIGLPACG
jgi:hypothetical protein